MLNKKYCKQMAIEMISGGGGVLSPIQGPEPEKVGGCYDINDLWDKIPKGMGEACFELREDSIKVSISGPSSTGHAFILSRSLQEVKVTLPAPWVGILGLLVIWIKVDWNQKRITGAYRLCKRYYWRCESKSNVLLEWK